MNSWIDEQIARVRYTDMLNHQRRRRMAEIVLSARRRRVERLPERFYSPALVRLGRWLVAWGCRLEARYGPIAETHVVTRTGGNISGC